MSGSWDRTTSTRLVIRSSSEASVCSSTDKDAATGTRMSAGCARIPKCTPSRWLLTSTSSSSDRRLQNTQLISSSSGFGAKPSRVLTWTSKLITLMYWVWYSTLFDCCFWEYLNPYGFFCVAPSICDMIFGFDKGNDICRAVGCFSWTFSSSNHSTTSLRVGGSRANSQTRAEDSSRSFWSSLRCSSRLGMGGKFSVYICMFRPRLSNSGK